MTRSIVTLLLGVMAFGSAQAKPRPKAPFQPSSGDSPSVPLSEAARAPGPPADASASSHAEEATSIVVTIRHINGDREKFDKNVDSMDLIFDPSGRLDAVHLVLLTNGEKDTHRWYLMQNLASLDYRFLSVAGKGKVRIRPLQPIKADGKGLSPEYPAINERDYR
jgi:hypothetical protein